MPPYLKSFSSMLSACVWIMWTSVAVSWLSFINSPAHHLLTAAASFDRLAQCCWLFIFSSQWPGDLIIIEKKSPVFCLCLKGMSFIHYGDQVPPCRAAQEERLIFRCGGSLPAWRGVCLVTPKSGIRRCRAGHATKIRLQNRSQVPETFNQNTLKTMETILSNVAFPSSSYPPSWLLGFPT